MGEPFHNAAREPFHYFDKGSMATVSRFSAVAKVGPLELSGFVAWVAWLLLHLVYLVGFKSKMTHCHFVDDDFPHDEQRPAHDHRAAGPCSTPRRAAHPTRFSGQGRITR